MSITHEIDEGRDKIAEENFKKAGVDKQVTRVLGDAHETVKRYKTPDDPLFIDLGKQESIDILFLDADSKQQNEQHPRKSAWSQEHADRRHAVH